MTDHHFYSFQTEKRISIDFVRASIITQFKQPEGESCYDFKVKRENEPGDSTENDESSDSSQSNENREKLVADVRCPLCPIKRINVFHKPSKKNVFLWNTSNWNRHLKDTHKLVDTTEFVDTTKFVDTTESIDSNREKQYGDQIVAKDETSPVFESSSIQNTKKYKLEKTNEIQANNLTANRTKKSTKRVCEPKIDSEQHLQNNYDSSDGEIIYGNDMHG